MILSLYATGVPIYLTNLPRWVLWRTEQRVNRQTGETTSTKAPISYHSSKHCDITDPHNWTGFDNVVAALGKSAAWDGGGFTLGEIDEHDEFIVGLDLDACLNEDGALADWAMPFLVAMGSYAEHSPGGAGIKCVARIRRSDLEATRKLLDIPEADREQARTRVFGTRENGRHAPGAQLFLMRRYFCITGRHWHASPEDVTLLTLGQIAQLGALFGPKEQRTGRTATQAADDDDAEPDEAALRDKLGAAFAGSPRLRARWEGGTQGLTDTTRSGRDMSVLAMLVAAGFSKGETRAALRLFEHGKLKDEPLRYFEQMWTRTRATPHVDPEPSPDWEEQHPAPSGDPQRARRRHHEPADLSTVWNPWEAPPIPAWPNGILSRDAELTLAKVSLRDGLDLGLLCTTILAGACAAAPKDARFAPYQHDSWSVPPILWIMTVGDSGTRKTRLEVIGFSAVREVHAEIWKRYRAERRQWEAQPAKERGPPPSQPHSFIVNDITPEALQIVLANTTRGTAMVKDELAGLLDFSRYQRGGGDAARAFYLSAYEDAGCPVHRVTRDSDYIEHTGLSLYGAVQPRRLEGFKPDMETDGMLQRFFYVRAAPAKPSRPDIAAGPGLATLHKAIRRLCHLTGRQYSTTPEGSELIRQTELLAREYATITDYGLGWPGFCYKLHATHARVALVLHLLDEPENPVIPADTIQRAHHLIHKFVLQHARDFYDSLVGSSRSMIHDIAGWLLTRRAKNPTPDQLERILASDLTNGVRSCRPLGSKAITDVLDPFVTGGWLVPETDYPSNRAWFFNPAIRDLFADREAAERQRRGEIRDLITRIANDRQAQHE